MLEHAVDLLARYAGKPAQELLDCGAPFKVLEKRAQRHAGSAKDPRAAYLGGVSFHGGARRPVEHDRHSKPCLSLPAALSPSAVDLASLGAAAAMRPRRFLAPLGLLLDARARLKALDLHHRHLVAGEALDLAH